MDLTRALNCMIDWLLVRNTVVYSLYMLVNYRIFNTNFISGAQINYFDFGSKPPEHMICQYPCKWQNAVVFLTIKPSQSSQGDDFLQIVNQKSKFVFN